MANFNHKPLVEKLCLSFTWHPPVPSPDLSPSTAAPPPRIPTSLSHSHLKHCCKMLQTDWCFVFFQCLSNVFSMLLQDTQFVSNRSSHGTLKETKQRETGERLVWKIICHEQLSKFHTENSSATRS